MAQTKHQIMQVLQDAGMRPRYRFGQNFMIDQNLVRIVAEAAQIAAGELVIEVGPGTGTLTEELLGRGASVLAVEIDRDLAGALRARFAAAGAFELIEGDALSGKHELNAQLLQAMAAARERGQAVKLAANLPYSIASPLIVEMLIAGVSLLAFTVQKEVADRLRAQAGSKDYGVLSIMSQLLAEVEVLRTLPPQAFWPAPKVESALVRMKRKTAWEGYKEPSPRPSPSGRGRAEPSPQPSPSGRGRAEPSPQPSPGGRGGAEPSPQPSPGVPGEGAELPELPIERVREFGVFVRGLFSARRKTLRKGLGLMGVDAESVLAAAAVDAQARPEDVTPGKMRELFMAARGARAER